MNLGSFGQLIENIVSRELSWFGQSSSVPTLSVDISAERLEQRLGIG